jgi:hypothetical protein
MNALFKRGHRLFSIASLFTIIIAVLHTLGIINEPYNDQWAAAQEAMRAATVDVGPATMSFESLFFGVWIQVGVLLALLGVKNLAILLAAPAGGTRNVVRTLSIIDGLVYAGLAVLFAVYTIPPPLISFIFLAILFFGAALSSRAIEK